VAAGGFDWTAHFNDGNGKAEMRRLVRDYVPPVAKLRRATTDGFIYHAGPLRDGSEMRTSNSMTQLPPNPADDAWNRPHNGDFRTRSRALQWTQRGDSSPIAKARAIGVRHQITPHDGTKRVASSNRLLEPMDLCERQKLRESSYSNIDEFRPLWSVLKEERGRRIRLARKGIEVTGLATKN